MQIRQARRQYFRWLSIAKDLSPHTIRAYEGDISTFENYVGGRTRVNRIGREHLTGFIEQQHAAGLSAKSIRRRVSSLRGFTRWLLSQRLADADPLTGVAVAAGQPRRLPRTVPTHDLTRLFASLRRTARIGENCQRRTLAHPHEATTLLAASLMLTTGARVHEVTAIQCDNLDISSRSLLILGKGRRERRVFLTNDWITELTYAYLTTRSLLPIEHPYLLFNSNLSALTAPALRTRLVKAGRDAGLATRVTPHMLRHTAATQLMEAGVDIRYIQRLLGHASLSTTEIYTHVSDRTLNRVISDADVLGRYCGGDN